MPTKKELEEEIGAWTEATCPDCGHRFPKRSPFEKVCLVCYKLGKGYDLVWGDKVTFWLQRNKTPTPPAQADPTPAAKINPFSFTEAEIKKLLSLIHPDKHQNSPLATEMTQAVLALRQKVKGTKKPSSPKTKQKKN